MPREIEDGARKYRDNNIRYTELLARCKMGAGDLQQIGRYQILDIRYWILDIRYQILDTAKLVIQLNMRYIIYQIHQYNTQMIYEAKQLIVNNCQIQLNLYQ